MCLLIYLHKYLFIYLSIFLSIYLSLSLGTCIDTETYAHVYNAYAHNMDISMHFFIPLKLQLVYSGCPYGDVHNTVLTPPAAPGHCCAMRNCRNDSAN